MSERFSFSFAPLKFEGRETSFDPSMTVEEAKRLDEQAYKASLKPITTIKAGELVAFTTGEYSDYSVMILLRAKTDFTNADMVDAVEKSGSTWPSESRYSGFDESKLLAYLASLDCFEEVRSREIHLGDYGRIAIHDYGCLTRHNHD